jgi:hypothetical protein
MEEKMVVG